ncbi:MAG: metallophosphoesterase family protein [Thermoanaerobaculia bacterium]|nr:MAG: metallophosphoesterase family protein [Thermoanaerobaculia bacterium]
MQFLILSDLHGNAEATDAVLRRVRRKKFDAVLVLGDLVGYGAGPNRVVEAVRNLAGPVHLVRGNHDKVVAGLEPGENFNHAALAAARWTAEHLKPANLRFVRELPCGPIDVPGGPTICHGSPLDEDQYVFSIFEAWEIFGSYPSDLVFFGHTHVPSMFVMRGRETRVALLHGTTGTIRIQRGERYLINPGSVGQPRDRDPRASYMTYDSKTRTVRWFRIPYPVERAQQRIVKRGLPRVLAERLALGV